MFYIIAGLIDALIIDFIAITQIIAKQKRNERYQYWIYLATAICFLICDFLPILTCF